MTTGPKAKLRQPRRAAQAGTIHSLRRGLETLEALADAGGRLPLTEIARQLGLNLSTAHHLVKTLQVQGYVTQEDGRAYRLSPRILRLASVVWNEDALARLAAPLVVDLALKTQETSHLAVFDRHEAIVIHKCDGAGPWRLFERLGTPRPAHCTALGKVLLAHQGDAVLRAYVQTTGLPRFTTKTITTVTALTRELRRVRERGHATDAEEFTRGIHCIAAPVFNFTGSLVAALGVSGPSWRVPLKDGDALAATVKEMAERLSRELGHEGKTS